MDNATPLHSNNMKLIRKNRFIVAAQLLLLVKIVKHRHMRSLRTNKYSRKSIFANINFSIINPNNKTCTHFHSIYVLITRTVPIQFRKNTYNNKSHFLLQPKTRMADSRWIRSNLILLP